MGGEEEMAWEGSIIKVGFVLCVCVYFVSYKVVIS